VGQAWIQYAREEVNPILKYEQFETLKEWYATEVRQLNHTQGVDGEEGADMPVPATVRELGTAAKLSIAFARVHLRERVTDEDVERAKALARTVVKQNWNGDNFDARQSNGSGGKYDQLKPDVIDTLNRDGPLLPDELSRMLSVDEQRIRDALAHYKERGAVIERQGRYETP